MSAGNAELNPTKRTADFQAADKLMAAGVPVFPFYQRPVPLIYKSGIKGMINKPLAPPDRSGTSRTGSGPRRNRRRRARLPRTSLGKRSRVPPSGGRGSDPAHPEDSSMLTYIARRVLYSIPVLIVSSFVSFTFRLPGGRSDGKSQAEPEGCRS